MSGGRQHQNWGASPVCIRWEGHLVAPCSAQPGGGTLQPNKGGARRSPIPRWQRWVWLVSSSKETYHRVCQHRDKSSVEGSILTHK